MRASNRTDRAIASRRKFISLFRVVLVAMLVFPVLAFGLLRTTGAKNGKVSNGATAKGARPAAPQAQRANTYQPTRQPVMAFQPLNFAEAARQEALAPAQVGPSEIRSIDAPKGEPPPHGGTAMYQPEKAQPLPQAPPLSATGASPGPSKTFKGEFLSSTSIPPDTMGAVGDNHVVNVTNDRMRIQTRDGVELSRVTLTSFWTGVTIKGATVSAFDPKVMYDRFNDRYILISTFNGQSISSGVGFAVSQTNDPTGLWNRYSLEADPTSTAGGGLWIDYPSMGFNKKWIVVNYNTFGFGTSGGGYLRSDIFVLDKQAAYANTLGTISAFQGATSTCTAPFEDKLGCGFTMAPTVWKTTRPKKFIWLKTGILGLVSSA